MKRFLSVLMAAALVFGLCACGEKPEPVPEADPVFTDAQALTIDDVFSTLRLDDQLGTDGTLSVSRSVSIYHDSPSAEDEQFNTLYAFKRTNAGIVSYFRNDDPDDGGQSWYGFDGVSGINDSYGTRWQYVYNADGAFTSGEMLMADINESIDWQITQALEDEAGLFEISCAGYNGSELSEDLLVILDPVSGKALGFLYNYYSGGSLFLTQNADINYADEQIEFDPTPSFADPHHVILHYNGQTYELSAENGTQLSFVDEIGTASGGVMEISWYLDELQTALFGEPDYGYIGTVTEDLELWGTGVWSETYPDYS